MEKDFFTVKGIMEHYAISRSKIHKATMNKELPYYKPGGGKMYFKKVDVDNWMFSGRVASRDEMNAIVAGSK